MRRLEPDDLECAGLPPSSCQSPVQRLCGSIDDAREIADFVHHLRLVAEVGEQHDVARRDEQQRARSREAGEVPDVRQARDEQPVEMRGRDGRRRAPARRAGGDQITRTASFAASRPRKRELVAVRPRIRTTTADAAARRASSAAVPARARRCSSGAPRRTAPRSPRNASRSARLVCVYAPALMTTPSTCAAQRVNRVDQLALAVVLRELELDAELRRDGAQRSLDVGERRVSVQRRLARAEQIQVRAVEDGDPHVFFSPLSQALNCAMSSLDRDGGSFGWPAIPGDSARPRRRRRTGRTRNSRRGSCSLRGRSCCGKRGRATTRRSPRCAGMPFNACGFVAGVCAAERLSERTRLPNTRTSVGRSMHRRRVASIEPCGRSSGSDRLDSRRWRGGRSLRPELGERTLVIVGPAGPPAVSPARDRLGVDCQLPP